MNANDGPWNYTRKGAYLVVYAPGDYMGKIGICKMPFPTTDYNKRIVEANARLICQAPEMLHLLEHITELLKTTKDKSLQSIRLTACRIIGETCDPLECALCHKDKPEGSVFCFDCTMGDFGKKKRIKKKKSR